MLRYKAGLIAIDWSSNELPTLPVVAQKLLSVVSSSEVSTEEFAKCIRQDPSITMKILRVVNSALFSLSIEISSVKHAIVLLGRREIRNIAFSYIMSQRFMSVPPEVTGYAEDLWRHSLATAIIAQDFIPDGEKVDLYTLGLLHDVGWIVLMSQAPTLYLAMARDINEDVKEFQGQWGVDHEFWGAEISKRWNLPPEFHKVALLHHDPFQDIDPPIYLLKIHLANYLAKISGFKAFSMEPDPVLDPRILEMLDIDQDTITEAIAKVKKKKEYIDTLWRMLIS